MKRTVSLILSLILLTGCFSFSANAENNGAEKALRFNKNGKFTILNFSDIQDGYPDIDPLYKARILYNIDTVNVFVRFFSLVKIAKQTI